MEIQYLLNKNIDLVKYNACISNAINTRIYAFSWYLDCVTDNWDVLVLGDYQAVMPLPRREKFIFSYIYQASWIQQLGVFFKEDLEENVLRKFISKIPKKFVLVDYFFNAENRMIHNKIKLRSNYILPLNKDFNTIKKTFNKNKKRISNTNFEDLILHKNGEVNDFLKLYKAQKINFNSHKDAFEKLERLLESKNKNIHIWLVTRKEISIGGLVWLKGKDRITYLIPVVNILGKKFNTASFLVNELIKTYQNTNIILDFEGSEIEGVAKFYKSFGAVEEVYYHFKQRAFF